MVNSQFNFGVRVVKSRQLRSAEVYAKIEIKQDFNLRLILSPRTKINIFTIIYSIDVLIPVPHVETADGERQQNYQIRINRKIIERE